MCIRDSTLYYVMALACGLVASFFIYSCSTDGYYSDEIEKNEVTNTRALSSRMINNGSTLIDSIASSDEFWEFEMSSELLADKFHEYTSTLSEEEYDKLMENLNDDDYVEDFMRKANLENELQQLAKAKENLIQHTGFLRLSADERTQLFIPVSYTHLDVYKRQVQYNTNPPNTNKVINHFGTISVSYTHLLN